MDSCIPLDTGRGMSHLWSPQNITLSGGGVLLIGQLGVVATLKEAGVLNDVKRWYGCSGGSIVALCGALGVSAGWMRELAQTIRIQQWVRIETDIVMEFTNRWGLNDGSALMEYIARIMDTWTPGSSVWTFAEMQRVCDSELYIHATNVSLGRGTIFSAELTPTMRILDAVRASIAIPIFFTPWQQPGTGHYFCDGCMTEFYPWTSVKDKDKTLVISTQTKTLQQRKQSVPIQSLSEYVRMVYNAMNTVVSPTPRHWIALNQKRFGTMDFGITTEDQQELFAIGETAARGWLAWRTTVAESKKPMHRPHDPHRSGSSGLPLQEPSSGSHYTPDPAPLPRDPQSDPLPAHRSRRWSL
jgi:NTE family protein